MSCPPFVFRSGKRIGDPLSKALEFVDRDWSYRHYDLAPVAQDNSLTVEDIAVANKIVARMSSRDQMAVLERAPAIGHALARIPPQATLVAPDDAVDWDALGELYRSVQGIPHIGLPRATKILHKKRPALIPILDSVVEAYLRSVDAIPHGTLAEVGVALTRSYKAELDANAATLACVRGALASQSILLTEVRILDMYAWAMSGVYDPWGIDATSPRRPTSSAPAKPPLEVPSDVALFVDDDEGYSAWLATYPSGFVVNAERNPSPRYLVLHRADCQTIVPTPGRAWTRHYIKLGSAERAPLDAWARRQFSAELKPCGLCVP
jgi:hypothetical protein